MNWNRRNVNGDGGDSASSRDDDFDYRRRSRDRRNENKVGQLCRQVQKTIQMSLGGECHDEVLQRLLVEAVQPAPDAGRLVVQVSFVTGAVAVPLHELLQRLEAVRPWIRREVARSIVRKRAPEIVFQLVNHQEVHDE